MDAKSLGPMIQRWRVEADFTQEELGDRAGLTKRAVGNIERGDRSPTTREIVRLCRALGRDHSELVTISYRSYLDELNQIAREEAGKPLQHEEKSSPPDSGDRINQIFDQLAALMKELYRESRSDFQKVFFDWLAQPGPANPTPPPRTRKRVRRKRSTKE